MLFSLIRTVLSCFILEMLELFDPDMTLGKPYLDTITLCEEAKRMLINDHLRWTGGCKVRILLAFSRCLQKNMDSLHNIDVPLLILHGQDDMLCNVDGSRLLVANAVAEDKTLHVFEEGVHQLFLERPRIQDVAIAMTADWLRNRSDKLAVVQQ